MSGKPSPNRIVYASPPIRRLGLRKTTVGLFALCVVFSSPHLGQGHCFASPITCPKRHIQPNVNRQFGITFSNYFQEEEGAKVLLSVGLINVYQAMIS